MAKKQSNKQVPVEKNEDIEFSRELADQEDMEAVARAESADERQE